MRSQARGAGGRRLFLFAALVFLWLSSLAGFSAQAQTAATGLDFPGDGAVRRMLVWNNPFPIYDATYVFKVFPRKKIVPTNSKTGYYTTFFWGNNGRFSWQNGQPNTYYGSHPYPIPAPNGPGQWEIAVGSKDFVTGSEVVWDRWYTQAFRAWRESPTITHHEFYWDLPDTSKVIRQTIVDPAWATVNPPTPAIVMGQAPNFNGASWRGYPGWDEFNGIIRGLQLYSGLLSVADIQAEIANPMSTTAGQNLIWYLNLNPRPSDVTDKKGVGTPHNPSWDGTTAREWVETGAPQPPVPTVSLTANPTSVTSGGASTLTWSSTNATSCTASGGWSGTKATSGSQSTGALTANGNFTLTCTGAGGSANASAAVTVTAAPPVPTVSLTANPTSVTSGGASTLTWSSTNATSCTASGGWSGTKATSGSQSTGALTASTDFILTCTGTGGSASVSTRVTFSASPVPTVSLAADPTSVTSGGASTLIWSSTNATSCTASGGWSGTKATSGSQSTGALTASGNFTLTCTGTGGSASTSATVTVAATGTNTGLDFPGDGAVRRMLVWNNPFPIYDATYVFKVFPRKKIVPTNSKTGYYTTFFWGNNGTFSWQSGQPNTYYGSHPLPDPRTQRAGSVGDCSR